MSERSDEKLQQGSMPDDDNKTPSKEETKVKRKLASLPPILYFDFNQDASCICVGSPYGYRIYSCNPFSKLHDSDQGGMAIVNMLFRSSLIVLVGAGIQPSLSPRTLIAKNTQTNKEICQLKFVSTILKVVLNRLRLVVVCVNKLHIFDLRSMNCLHTLDTAPNPKGVCALSTNDKRCYLAIPALENKGDVMLYDAMNLQVTAIIHAHENPVRCLSFNKDGSQLATASTKGTVLRVFSVPEGKKLHTFRRGTYTTDVHAISFNPSSTFVCLSSDSRTIHIFDLTGKHSKQEQEESPVLSATRTATSTIANYLPSVLQDVIDPNRHFAHVHLKDNSPPTIASFASDHSLMVASASGYCYRYTVPDKGGECKLSGEYSLLDSPSEAMGVRFHEGSEK